MNWLFFAILAPAVYAIVVFIDKYILAKEVTDYRGMPIYSSVIAVIFGVLIWIATGFPSLKFNDSLLIILTGVLTVFGLAFYFKALSTDEASKITILFQITPVLTLILSYLLLGDQISFQQFLGFTLILLSTLGISFNQKLSSISLTNVFFLILLTDFFWALAFVIFKFVSENNAFSSLISYEGFGMGVGGFILYKFFPSIRNSFEMINKKVGSRIFWFIVINEAIFLISRLLTYLAISKGSVALVEVVGGTQVIFAIFYGILLTKIAPKIFEENTSLKGLSKKLVLAGVILVGLWLVHT